MCLDAFDMGPALPSPPRGCNSRPLGTGHAGPAERFLRPRLAGLAAAMLFLAGCTSMQEWWQNGFKVGPNYGRPPALVAEQWMDADDPNVRSEATDYGYWWEVFDDPVLDELVETAYQQNLPLEIAGLRILEARAQRAMAAGTLLPQQQQLAGSYSRNKFSSSAFPFGGFPIRKHFDDWFTGFDAAWELDFWGRFRRMVEAADANLDAQIENYDDVLVILQAEVAGSYIQMRALQERLALAEKNVALQEETLRIVQQRFRKGVVSELDVRQAKANLGLTQSLIPVLEAAHRTAQNKLCILLGIPPRDLRQELDGPRPIPTAPPEIAVGIPAGLLRRRPDVRRAERQAAAQCAQIGMATADLYPRIAITGTIGIQAEQFGDLFDFGSIAGSVGPGFQWNVLNYGRIGNNIRVQEARFQQAVVNYQHTVLRANEEVENAIVAYLQEHRRAKTLDQVVRETERAVELAMLQYDQGIIDYQRVLDTQRGLVQQQDNLAESRGKVAMNLVAVYKAVAGGWRVRYAPAPLPTDRAQAETPFEEEPPPET